MAKPNEYYHIKAWGQYLGSYSYYIKGEQEKAAADNAPINAISKKSDGIWSTADDIRNEDLRNVINENAQNLAKRVNGGVNA